MRTHTIPNPDNSPFVLSLCDYTGNIVEPWAEAGYRCICVDLSHPEEITVNGRVTLIRADVRLWLPPLANYRFVFAAPPCTDVAVSGARYFASKGIGKLAEALALVDACRTICEWSGAPWLLENPVSTLSTYWRKPDFYFDPYQYGGYDTPDDAYTKRTCLWTSSDFRMPPYKPVPPTQGSRMHRLPPDDDRTAVRSATPLGFARAVFRANSDNALDNPKDEPLIASHHQATLPYICHD